MLMAKKQQFPGILFSRHTLMRGAVLNNVTTINGQGLGAYLKRNSFKKNSKPACFSFFLKKKISIYLILWKGLKYPREWKRLVTQREEAVYPCRHLGSMVHQFWTSEFSWWLYLWESAHAALNTETFTRDPNRICWGSSWDKHRASDCDHEGGKFSGVPGITFS